MTEDLKHLLKTGAAELGITIGDREASLFLIYLTELKEWNKKINLTAITDDRGIVIKHFLDSLTLAPFLKDQKTLLDIGSGAGFPGIPLKIVLPDLNITLIDSANKKVVFMRHIIRTLGLKDIQSISGRAEDRQLIEKLGRFDAVTSRAFAELKEFLKIAEPYVKENGLVFAVKGPKGIKEMEEAEEIKSLSFVEKRDVRLPFSDIITTTLVFMKKEQKPC